MIKLFKRKNKKEVSKWDWSKEISMIPRGKNDPKFFNIDNVLGLMKSTKLNIQSTYYNPELIPVIKGSNESTKKGWDRINRKLLEAVLAAKNEQYKIKPVN